jgi:hypothetical protein
MTTNDVSTDGDRYSTWDAAYVLGALSSVERREYEAHLETCTRCRAAVGELGGMPALLAMLDADEIAALEQPGAAVEHPPLRPVVRRQVLDRVRAGRRRSRWLMAAAAAMVAAIVAVGVVIAVNADLAGRSADSSTSAAGMPMTKLADTPFSATVALSGFGWGTRIDMACSYGSWSGGEQPPPTDLGMVVVGRDGSRTQVATWLGLSGATALPSGNTPMPSSDIAAVQLISVQSGKVLLERRL